jgi:hypothetical protein
VPTEAVIDLDSRQVVVVVRGFESFSIAAPAAVVESRLWSWFERPLRADTRRFVDELIAGSLRPRVRAHEVAALPERVRARLRLALVDALGERSRWRSLYGSPLSQDERLFALMLWRRDRFARQSAELLARLRSRVAKASRVQVDRSSLVGRVMDSMDRRERMLRATSPLDRRVSALDMALGRKGSPKRSPFAQFGFAKGFASGLFGHGRDELVRPFGVGAFRDDAVGVSRIAKAAAAMQSPVVPDFGADIRKRVKGLQGLDAKPGIFGAKGPPTVAGRLARGEGAALTTSKLAGALGEHTKLAKVVGSMLGLGGANQGLRPELFGRVAGFDVTRFRADGTERSGRTLLFGNVFKDIGLANTFKDAGFAGGLGGTPPWLSKLPGAFPPGFSDGRFVITGNLRAAFPDFEKLQPRYLDALRRLEEQAQVALFERQWERDALWYLLYHLDERFLVRLARLEREEVEEVVLDALEGAVRDEEFSAALQEGVGHAAMLNSSQRRHLQHALEHAEAGEWVDASPPLMSGLEGAFWATAHERAVINADRTRADNPNKLIKGVENVVRLVVADEGFSLFVRRRVFGTTGDPYRHGDADGGERRQVLLGIAALCGWVDSFVGLPALPVLSVELNEQMPDALDRADERGFPPGT